VSEKRVVLCADDFGLAPGVSRGIMELLETGRLSATSCMVNYPEFGDDARALKSFIGRADLGLHFSLTDSRSISSVALECHLRPPPFSMMLDAVERQVEIFSNAMGILPDYIDGHQHVHVLPVVRDAVVNVAKRVGAYTRVPWEPINQAMWHRPAPLESAYLARASRALAKLARGAGIPTNHGFRGVRTFREKIPFSDLFRAMIAGAGEGCLVMCHPGHIDAMLGGRDSVLEPRADEWSYFSGPDFPADLAGAGLTLSRLRETVAQDGLPRAKAR
jgi:chitin disaccharide deacetylase